MIRFTKKETGDVGEEYAVKYLKKHGCKILARNYRKKYGEIDIVAKSRDYILFVEVKTRHNNPYTQPYEAVDFRKQRKIILTSSAYLSENKIDSYCRFDVCEVFVDENTLKLDHINYIKNAFEAGDNYARY